jgi:hypothetical protein
MPPAVKRPEVKPEEEKEKDLSQALASRIPPNIQTTSYAKLGCRKCVAAERKKKRARFMHSARKHAENPPMQMQLCVCVWGNRWNQRGMKEGKPPLDAACAGKYIEEVTMPQCVARTKMKTFKYLDRRTRKHQGRPAGAAVVETDFKGQDAHGSFPLFRSSGSPVYRWLRPSRDHESAVE